MKKSSPTIFEKTGKFQGGVNLKNFKGSPPRYQITLSNHNPTKLGGWVMTLIFRNALLILISLQSSLVFSSEIGEIAPSNGY